MRRCAAALVAALAATACLRVVPRQETTRVEREVRPAVVEEVAPLELAARVEGATAIVTARWPRRCRHDVVETTEVASWDTVRVAGTDDGETWGYWLMGGLVIAWPVGLAVGGASLVGVVAQRPRGRTTERTVETVSADWRSCALHAAHLRVALSLPSGAVVEGVTDETGTAVFLLPAGEEGMVVASASGAVPGPDAPALRRGPPAPEDRRRDVRLAALERTAESRASARDCATVRIIGREVRALDARFYASSFRANQLIARCAP